MHRSDHELEYKHYNGQTTDFDLQFYQDEAGKEDPLFFVRESPDNKGPSLDTARSGIAQEMAEKYDLKPEQVRWVEQKQDGSLQEYDFKAHTQTVRPYEQDLTRKESGLAEKKGQLPAQEITYFTGREKAEAVKPEALQERVGREESLDFKTTPAAPQQKATAQSEPAAPQQQKAAQREHDLRGEAMPAFDRSSLDPNELTKLQEQVDTKQAQEQQAQTQQL